MPPRALVLFLAPAALAGTWAGWGSSLRNRIVETSPGRFEVHTGAGSATLERGAVTYRIGATSFGVQFENASAAPRGVGPGVIVNDIHGSTAIEGRSFASVSYREIFRGVDATANVGTGRLKIDYKVAVGARPENIRLRYLGVTGVFVDSEGNLGLVTSGGLVTESIPAIYQQDETTVRYRTGRFALLDDGAVSFSVADYDPQLPLVIDPVLDFSYRLGGTSIDQVTAVCADSDGNIYLAGWTDSSDFTTQPAAGTDAFVAKLDPTGSTVLALTLLGGRFGDRALGATIDTSGQLWIVGSTNSSDFPITGGRQASLSGTTDAFVAELNTASLQVMYSSLFGGPGDDSARAVAAGPAGQIYIGGETTSSALVAALTPARPKSGTGTDGFVVQVDATGLPVWYTFLGGVGADAVLALCADDLGDVYAAGSTASSDFPVLGGFQTTRPGAQSGFVLKMAGATGSLLYSSYLGGSSGSASKPETAYAIAVDGNRSAFVAGATSSADFPLSADAPQRAFRGASTQAYLTQVLPSGSDIGLSTLLGGSGAQAATAVRTESDGTVILAGWTSSVNFPTINAFQTASGGASDAFIAQISPDTRRWRYASYVGRESTDMAVALTRSGPVVIAGNTLSPSFPAIGGNGQGPDVFLARVSGGPPLPLPPAAPGNPTPATNSNVFPVNVTLSWAAAEGSVSYDVYLGTSTDPAFACSTGTTAYSPAALRPATTYYWRVVARNQSGGTSSPVWRFTTAPMPLLFRAGVFRNGFLWVLDVNGNLDTDTPPDKVFGFGGVTGDIPITGDWNGDGRTKSGVYRPGNGLFILDYDGDGLLTGADKFYNLGVGAKPGDIPVSGDWNGDGRTKIGIFRDGYFWMLDYNGNGVFDAGDRAYAFGGDPGDIPVVGDWTGEGRSKIGLFRQGYFWILDANGNGAFDGNGPGQDFAFPFGGISGDVPVTGDWNGDRRTKVGVFRAGFFWVLDGNGNHQFDGTGLGQDFAFAFGGVKGDKPVTGKW